MPTETRPADVDVAVVGAGPTGLMTANLLGRYGLRAAVLPASARLSVAGHVLERARTFGDRPAGTAMWYENSNGLAEIAVNQGRADRDFGLSIGTPVAIT